MDTTITFVTSHTPSSELTWQTLVNEVGLDEVAAHRIIVGAWGGRPHWDAGTYVALVKTTVGDQFVVCTEHDTDNGSCDVCGTFVNSVITEDTITADWRAANEGH